MDYVTSAGLSHSKAARETLIHYFRIALGGELPSDADVEIGEAVDDIVRAAIAELQPSLRSAFDAITAVDQKR